MASENILLNLLNQKHSLLLNINNVGIIWWTTTIVFSVSIIGLMWKEKEKISSLEYWNSLRWTVTFFYITAIAFGILMVWTVDKIEGEAQIIIKQLVSEENLISNFGFMGSKFSFGIGAIDFLLIIIFWFVFSRSISKDNGQNKS